MLKTEKAKSGGTGPCRGCIIEVDMVALGGIGKIYEICKRHLGEMNVAYDVGLFGRYQLGAYLEAGLNRLLQSLGRGGAPELARGVRDDYLKALAEHALAPNAPVVELVNTLSAKQVKVGLLTRMEETQAGEVLAPMLAQANVSLLCETQHALVGGFPWDVWRRNVAKMHMEEKLCVALVAGAASCKAALAAGLPTVVATDDLTMHQDFCGARHVADQLDDDVAQAVLSALRLK